MSKDFDDIYKKIDQSHKELYKKENDSSVTLDNINKGQDKLAKEISDIKKQVKDISFKVDVMLEILNNFTIMIAEEGELENYDDEDDDESESWIPEQEEDWNSYEEDDD